MDNLSHNLTKLSETTAATIGGIKIYNHSNNHPINNKIIVFIDTVKAPKTSGGLYIPEESRRGEAYAKTTGIILELGQNAFKDIRDQIKVGDRVTFRSYSGIDVQEYHEDIQCNLFYRILEDKEIHAVYSKTEKPNN